MALNSTGQGLERGNIKGVKPLGTCSDQVRQYRQKTRQRLACARGGDKQSMLSGLRCRKHVQLMTARHPPPVRKPLGQRIGQAIVHAPVLALSAECVLPDTPLAFPAYIVSPCSRCGSRYSTRVV